jgi:hypothetical protein
MAIDDVLVQQEASAQTVDAPSFSPSGGIYTEPQTVAINCETDEATIYYTTDGKTPTNQSLEYTGTITVSTPTTLKAIAYKNNTSSAVTTATYYVGSYFVGEDFHNETGGYT